MVRLNLLEPFDTYRVTPPLIMPEEKSDRKKHHAFVVVAPSIEAELKYLSENKILSFRNLYEYFIDKKWTASLYGQGQRIVKLNAEGEITQLLNQYRRGNLHQIGDITSYLPTAKSNVLKSRNVLVECNYVGETILSNPKDRRRLYMKIPAWVNEVARIRQSASDGYVGEYTTHLIIPMDLWFTVDDYENPSLLWKPTCTNPMAHFLKYLCTPAVWRKFGRVYLIHDRCVLPLNFTYPNAADESDNPQEYVMDLVARFMAIARRTKTAVLDDPTDDEISNEEAAAIEGLPEGTVPTVEQKRAAVEKKQKTATKLTVAEKTTIQDIAAEKVIEATGADPDAVDSETRTKTEKAIKTALEKHAKEPENLLGIKDGDSDVTEVDIHKMPVEPETTAAIDDIVAAKAAGKSVQSYQRDKLLSERYKDLSIAGQPISEIEAQEKDLAIPDITPHITTINPKMRTIRSSRFDETYNANLAIKDLTNILLHFSRVSPAMFLIKDVVVEDVSTNTDRVLRYTVEFEDETRKRHKFSFKLPKMYQDKYFYLNGQKMNLIHQKFPYPVTKVAPDRCQAVSNYKKIFTSRYGANISPRITKLRKILCSPDCPRCIKITKGDATPLNKTILTTIEYDEIGSSMVRMDVGNSSSHYTIYFTPYDAAAVVDSTAIEQTIRTDKLDLNVDDLIQLGVKIEGKIRMPYYLNIKTNIVYDGAAREHGELSEFIVNICGEYDKTFQKEMDDTSAGTKFVYSISKVMKRLIPTILAISAADPGGLTAVLEKSNVTYRFSETRPTVDKTVQGVIPFSDGYLVFDRYPFENSLLMNGLLAFPSKEYSFYDMNNRDTYVDIFDGMFGSRSLIDGLQNFYYMFIDPITYDVLTRLKMPTDFTRLMLYCNDMLADNSYQIDSVYYGSRLRSNEIVMAYLYMELADAWGYYRIGKTDKFSIPEDAVLKDLVTANIVDPHSELNIVLEMENDRQVKLKGPSGMNEDHSFTLEKRAYHPTMQGLIGMNSTPSGEVAIARHLTLNPNIVDARGFIKVDPDATYDGTELTTPGELMQAFGPESADIERVAMSISQSKHVVPVEDTCSSPVSYDMERLAPYLSEDYARTAKKDGKVVAIENDIMIVQYNDGTFDDVDLSMRPAKNTDGGFYIMNQFTTDLKVGQKVTAGQLIAIDPKYMSQADMFGDPLANMGTLARIAIETNGGVFEDSCYITDSLAHRMKTKITRQKRVILSKYANIKSMVRVGDRVDTNDPLITFDDTNDEFTSQLLQAMASEVEDADEVVATSAPVISKINGTITDIRITYTVDLDVMTPTLRKVVEKYTKETKKREKTLAKYMNVYDANTITKSSDKLVPDGLGKVLGVKLDGVMIDFYIEYEDIMAPGDKLSYYSALKGIVSDVIPDDLAPYSETNEDRKIEACLSAIGVYKRMCLDVIKVGGMNKIVVEKKRKLKEKYGERVKAELKKL